MTITPQGQLYLCKTPLENDYKNQLTFANATAQMTYFNSVIQKTYDNYTYIKKDNSVKIGVNIDEIIDCNYLFYRNVGFSTRWYFCFITNMEYVNENCTLVTFETDCYQTWLFDIEYKQSFVEREHVNDDTVGLHTVPENVETGEYICNSKEYDNRLDTYTYIMQVTEWISGTDKPLATNFGGIYMAGGAYICPTIEIVVNLLQAYATAGKSDTVYNLFIVPNAIVNNTSGSQQYSGQTAPVTLTKSITKPTSIDGYTPVNKKLLTYPFNYLLVSNNNGSSNILQYERFSGETCDFNMKGVPTVGASIKLLPSNYDVTDNEEQGLLAGKFPTLNWASDEYTNWLTQNAVNLGLGATSSALTIVGGLGMMSTGELIGGGSTLINGAMSIANLIGSVYQHSLQPNSAKGSVNGGDINTSDHKNGFFYYNYSIKEEYARIIDGYFSMFGYKVNQVKVPNITGRTNWNYVKTVNCNFDGDIPQADLNIIKAMFNNGVTLWHNPATMYNYGNSNNIVS